MPRSPVSLADLFREMKRLGIAPTIDNWNVIMWNYAKHGHVRKVEQFWERLREQPALKPNQLTFNTMLVAYATLVNDQAGRPTVTEIYKAIADG